MLYTTPIIMCMFKVNNKIYILRWKTSLHSYLLKEVYYTSILIKYEYVSFMFNFIYDFILWTNEFMYSNECAQHIRYEHISSDLIKYNYIDKQAINQCVYITLILQHWTANDLASRKFAVAFLLLNSLHSFEKRFWKLLFCDSPSYLVLKSKILFYSLGCFACFVCLFCLFVELVFILQLHGTFSWLADSIHISTTVVIMESIGSYCRSVARSQHQFSNCLSLKCLCC